MQREKCFIYTLLAVVFAVYVTGCGGGGGSPTPTVSGVAATGAPMTGTVFLKDAANNPEMSQQIASGSGAFSFNVSGKTPPFLLRAGSMYSMSNGPGRANINPMTNLMVAQAGAFTNMSSLNGFYMNPNGTQMRSMFTNMSTARLTVRQKLAPLMTAYGVANQDPMTSNFTIGNGMDRMFDDVKMSVDANGNVTMMYVNGTPLFTGQMGNMAGGNMMTGNIVSPGNIPASTFTVTPNTARLQADGTQQFTASIPVTWSVVNTNGGTVTQTGLYTAPAVPGMYLLKATSAADTSQSVTVTVMVSNRGMMM
ncbi:hypothetical protein GEOBRER4_n0534 [Citrifermentans bremense]|uniref:Uncharacterized protein n=1 Tax=Citrifermentans bremense TaxID=60035 RepID=A0A6S6M308_9BACT|nr:hypothetical protein [Citrifermentans bremense]BCG45765.1 hypothetical protein GEOBRER4_n0534 [Citrifermentans bremense]